ncbi:MAG: DMT family transporter [Candidatus Bathyarchaeia archaeon]|jgi:DME family drug/metabolite transporter
MIGEFAALGAAISWAVAPLFYRNALEDTNPVSANIVRCVTNGLVLTVLLVASGTVGVLASLPTWVILVAIVSGAIGLGVGDTLYMLGLKTIGVSRAVPLASTYPLFSLLWAVLFLNQPLSFMTLTGAAIILLGIWLLSKKNSQSSDAKGKRLLTGVLASLATAVAWSASLTLMDAVFASGISGLDANYAIVTVRIASLAVMLTAFSPFIDRNRNFLKITRKTLITLCVGGLVANGLGWLLINYSFLYIPETQAVPISSTSPLFAALAGFLFFKEKATWFSTVGAVAVVAGIFLIFLV